MTADDTEISGIRPQDSNVTTVLTQSQLSLRQTY